MKLVRDRAERERGCGRPITNGTTHGTDPSAAAESAFPEGAYPSKSRKGRCGRLWSEGSREALSVGCIR